LVDRCSGYFDFWPSGNCGDTGNNAQVKSNSIYRIQKRHTGQENTNQKRANDGQILKDSCPCAIFILPATSDKQFIVNDLNGNHKVDKAANYDAPFFSPFEVESMPTRDWRLRQRPEVCWICAELGAYMGVEASGQQK
jgi:hypothetical protein